MVPLSITWPLCEVSACKTGALGRYHALSQLVPARLSRASTLVVWVMFTTSSAYRFETLRGNFDAIAPGVRKVKTKCPSLSELVVRVASVARFVAFTFAPATTGAVGVGRRAADVPVSLAPLLHSLNGNQSDRKQTH